MDEARKRWGYCWEQGFDKDETRRLGKEIILAKQIFTEINVLEEGFPLHPESSGREHDIYIVNKDEFAGRYVKITKDETPGIILELGERWNKATQNYEPYIKVRKSFPSEYLQRLFRHNEILNDDTTVHGIITSAEAIQFIITQPTRYGEHPENEDVVRTLLESGFRQVSPAAIENPYLREFSYYHQETNLLLSDAKGSNFVKTATGLAPIDLIPQRPDEKFAAFINEHLE